MRLLRTIRFDASDEHVFERAAASGEWAVSGAFAFADDDASALAGKRRQAFRSAFLGTTSFGHSTFTAVALIGPDERADVVDRLAEHLWERYGAPSETEARAAAEDEVAFAEGLARHPVNTIVAVERSFGPEGIVERFRTIEAAGGRPHTRIWALVPDEDDAGG